LRRTLVIALSAVAALILAASAYAAINTYQANISLTTKKAGTASKPVPLGFNLDLQAAGTHGNRSAVLLDIKTKIYGVVFDGKDFPTCSLNKIATAKNDTVCPKGAEVATGSIQATLGSNTDFKKAGAACDPNLDVWNSGQGKLTFFFVDTPTHQCLGGALHTGSTGPYPATYKEQGKYSVMDIPIPGYIDFPVQGLDGSLSNEHLTFLKSTRKVHGKTVAAIASVACKGSKRPYSVVFKSTLPPAGPATETHTISKSAPC
jgi:hypothetical protein